MSKCSGCPLENIDIWCSGEIAPVICQGKDTIYREMLEGYKTNGITSGFNTSVFEPIQQKENSADTVILNKELSDSRLSICSSCEHYDSLNYKCNLCGCGLIAKTYNPNESCPIARW